MFRTKKESKTKVSSQNSSKKLIDKNEDFYQWYLWILQMARIVDTNYSVKGSYVWLDWGYALYNNIYQIIQDAYKNSSHKQMQFPTLIKEETFMKETEFIRNFEDDVFWVDREGNKKLQQGERLALRPTSEMIIYPMFANWIRSYRDLPLKIFQNVSIFRCETNETRPLIRNRETIGFIEGHAALKSEKEALEHLEIIWDVYRKFCESLGIPVVLVEVPEWERFAGSKKTVDGYVILTGSKSMELFTTAYLGTTFSDIFNIEYLDDQKKSQKAHLLCYGPSIDRILATLISIYGDNKGLRLLPEISPIEIVIVPIFNQRNKEAIFTYAHTINSSLLKMNFRTIIDSNELTTPGSKFYEAERLGIPLRIEIGQKELQNNTITIYRRDTSKKVTIKYNTSTIKRILQKKLGDISHHLREEIKKEYQNHIISITDESIEQYLQSNVFKHDYIYEIGWCGTLQCAEKLEELTNFSLIGIDIEKHHKEVLCANCSKNGKITLLVKRY